MSATFASYSPMPLVRLLLAPRAFVVLIGGSAWTLGASYFGAMARFKSMELEPIIESDIFGALIATLFLYGLPALMGVTVGEAAQEVFRRPMINRLPGITRRISRSALVLGALVAVCLTLAVQLAWGPLGWRLFETKTELPCPLATLSIACMGFAAGSWLLTRVGNGWGWVLRFAGFAALANFALPLLRAGTDSTPVAIVVLCLSIAVASQRYRPNIVRKMAEGSVSTVFGSAREWVATDNTTHAKGRPASTLVPPKELGRGIKGWVRADSYVRQTALNWIKPWQAVVMVAAYALFVSLLFPIISWIGSDKGAGMSVLPTIIEALFQRFGREDRYLEGSADLVVLIIGMASGLLAFFSVQFTDKYFHPRSRKLKAQLVFRLSLFVGFGLAASILVLGLGIGLVLQLLGGEPWVSGIPIFAIAALVNLLLFPFFQWWSVHFRSLFLAGHYLRGGALLLIPLTIAPVLILKTTGGPFAVLVASSPLLGCLGYCLALALSFAMLHFFLRRHFRRADLVLG